eukprot:897912-Prymnesium_polylepis.1
MPDRRSSSPARASCRRAACKVARRAASLGRDTVRRRTWLPTGTHACASPLKTLLMCRAHAGARPLGIARELLFPSIPRSGAKPIFPFSLPILR